MSAPRTAPAALPLADAEARERIVKDRTRSLSIDAGAGTGKTRLLVKRVLERVAQGGDLRRLAIITFTRKAAAELQRRIRTELAKRAGEQRFEEALAQLEQAPIGTTDSFCRGLLADVALEAGISPGFAVADEVAASAIRDHAWSRLLARSTPAHEDLVARLREAAVHLREVRRVAEAVLDHRDLVIPNFEAPAPEPLLPACRAACEELERVSKWCTDPNDNLLVRIRAAIAAVRQASSLPPREGDAFLLELRGNKFGHKSAGKKDWWGGAARKEEAANALERLDALAERFVEVRSTHLAAQAIAWIREYADEVAAAKRERAVLDFRDLALVTRDLLRSNERLREKLAARFDEILLDEAQDSDPLQTEIAFLLAAARPDPEDPIASRPGAGKLLLVGDPKQSIYRFRRADIELYERARASLVEGGGGETIITNFRSQPAILEFVNEVFSRWMEPQPEAGIQARYVPLVPDPELVAAASESAIPETTASRVHVLLPDAARIRAIRNDRRRDEEDQRVIREAEADAVARAVAHVLGKGGAAPWNVCDPETKAVRSTRASDVAVLVRRLIQGDAIQEALQGAGIAAAVSGGKRFYAREEIATLTAVLRAVAAPEDSFARWTALRSAAFGFDDDLLVLHALGKSIAHHPHAAKLAEVLASLHKWSKRARLSSPAEFLPILVEELSLTTLFGLRRDGRVRAEALAMLVDAAESLEEAGLETLPDVADWLAAQDAESRAEAPGELEPEGDDAVQVLTMHKAKGLEFPIVILADFGAALRESETVIANRAEGTLAIRFGGRDGRVETPGYEAALEDEKKRKVAEEVRLLYVAMTRARDHLILSWMPRPSKFLKDSALSRWIGAEPGQPPPDASRVHTIRASDLPPLPEADMGVTANVTRARSRKGAARIAAWAAEREAARRGARTIRASGGEDAEPERAGVGSAMDFAGDSPSGGAPFGEIVHRALERADLGDPASAARALDEALAAIAGGTPGPVRDFAFALDDAGRHSLRSFLERVLRDREIAQLARAPRLHREVPFVLPAGGDFVTGAVDLLVEGTDGTLWLFDYKTDRLVPRSAAELPLRYRRQALLSSFALATIIGRPVRAFRFLFVAADPVIPITIDIDDEVLAEARSLIQRVRSISESVLSSTRDGAR